MYSSPYELIRESISPPLSAHCNDRKVDYIRERGTGVIDEDVLLMQDNIFGVFDGASSINGQLFSDGTSGGFLAAQQAAEVFKLNQGSLLELTDKANRLIRNHMATFAVDLQKKWNRWSTSMAVVRIEENYFDWCQIGDCLILTIKRDGSFHMLVQDPGQDEETFAEWKKLNPSPDDNILDLLQEKIIEVREKMNVEYGSLNGEKQALDFANSGREPLEGIADIILYTDGLSLPCSGNEKSENSTMEQFVSLYHQRGVGGILEHVRSLQKKDTSCHLYPRFKMHDDATAIAITFP
ncbi:protein phosphatase 2C domain-containing protein [Desulfogranum japonicum]|uniref:protein phosphatase 2C domain-containing protein n=1 Tax=Desulfogranum japonicum TaxID=231447 RepID=UPI000422D94A|nr:protein phosphatase 2C domain-containing protein [Desulfogranum japonicum]